MNFTREETQLIAEAMIAYTEVCQEKASLYARKYSSPVLTEGQNRKVEKLFDLRNRIARFEWPE